MLSSPLVKKIQEYKSLIRLCNLVPAMTVEKYGLEILLENDYTILKATIEGWGDCEFSIKPVYFESEDPQFIGLKNISHHGDWVGICTSDDLGDTLQKFAAGQPLRRG